MPVSDLIKKMWFFSFGQIYVRFQVLDGPAYVRPNFEKCIRGVL